MTLNLDEDVVEALESVQGRSISQSARQLDAIHAYIDTAHAGYRLAELIKGLPDELLELISGDQITNDAKATRVHGDRVKAGKRRRRPPLPPGSPRPRRRRRSRTAALDGQLVGNWVDVFTPVLTDGELPTQWPETLLIDRKASSRDGIRGRRFNVLAAVGVKPAPPGRWASAPKAWRMQPFARKDTAAWVEFLDSLDGTPQVIVTDADAAIRRAIGLAFPRAGVPMRPAQAW